MSYIKWEPNISGLATGIANSTESSGAPQGRDELIYCELVW